MSRPDPPPTPPGPECFDRRRWAALGRRAGEVLPAAEIQRLVATGEPVSHDEVVEIYLPLAELLARLAEAKRRTEAQIDEFLDRHRGPTPFVVGIAGSVAVGKSTTARLLQALLGRGPGQPAVDLLTTDGFLYPNAVLEARGLMARKGFPESYDQRALLRALAALRAGQPEVRTPVYSHRAYDILPGEEQVLRQPAVVIVEGLNVLQVNTRGAPPEHVVVSDFFDFSIYVDADEEDIARWFRERLQALRSTVLRETGSYFYPLASLSDAEMEERARRVWTEVNLVNLRENVAPTRGRADLVLEKGGDQRMRRILLRRG